jgi:hypothetical protein
MIKHIPIKMYKNRKQPHLVVHACNPSTQKVEDPTSTKKPTKQAGVIACTQLLGRQRWGGS